MAYALQRHIGLWACFLRRKRAMESKSKNLQKDAPSVAHYDQTLRVIGQALEPLEIQDFDLEIDGYDYTVRGQSASKKVRTDTKPGGLRNALKNAWDKFEAKSLGHAMPDELPSPFVVLELHFEPDDIDRLERQGRAARRSDSKGATNPNRLSQILRALGAYVKRKSVRLLKISKRKDWVSVEYEKAVGVNGVENFRTTDLYDFWVHLYKQRKTPDELSLTFRENS
jgi:hypothetical protein